MHVRCPHCHNPIELLDGAELEEILCTVCGSSFSLVEAGTTTYDARGQTIGHFELVEQVGIGGFGSVWKAKDTELDRTVAVKIPRKDQLNAAETEQFLREARAVAQLRHPHIVSVHEVGREEGQVYIVSDFVQGATLSDWMEGQPLSAREAAELCAKVAEALHHAHEAGVIHRDLKPSNIMLDLEGEPHLMDFGVAKREAGEITMTMEGQLVGTPAYMSPEQARGEGHTADRRSDVYSLGVILFRLLTGELPFRGNARMLIVQILTDDPPSPRKLNSSVPRDLETICLKCLEKEPVRRYASAHELADELLRFISGEPIRARPVSTPERLWRWCRRKPVVAGFYAVVTILLLLLTIGGPLVARTQSKLRQEAQDSARAERQARDKAEELVQAEQRARDEALTLAKRNQQLAEQEREERERAEQLLYVSQIASAQRAWEAHDVGAAWESLNACRPDFRGWEHDYLYTLFNSNQRTLQGHTGFVNSVAFSPDGTQIVSGSDDKTLKVWDAATGQETFTLRGHTDPVMSVAFSPDGTRIVSGGGPLRVLEPGEIKVWDAATGQETLTLRGHTHFVASVAFSPDGTRIVSGGGDANRSGEIKLWHAATGQETLTLQGHTEVVMSVAFSPDGARIVSGSYDKTLKVWDAATGQETLTLQAHTGPVWSVAFSPDGARIVSGSSDRTIKVWDAATGQETRRRSHPR